MAGNYSITAYKIEVKDREKGVGGVSLKDLTNMSHYHNLRILIDGFLRRVSGGVNDRNVLFKLISSDAIEDLNGLSVRRVKMRYGGRNGTIFSVVSGKKETYYSPDDKIVRDYTIYFFYSNSVAYMVALRVGFSSCKTAIEQEFQRLLENGNVMVSFSPISNNEFIMNHYQDCNFTSLSYETLYKSDCGDVINQKERRKDTFSSVSINLLNERNKRLFSFDGIKSFLSGTVKSSLIGILRTQINEKDYDLDEESIKVEVELKGTKRSVSINALSNLMFDVDITSLIQLDEDAKIIDESLDEVVKNYMEGIINYEN